MNRLTFRDSKGELWIKDAADIDEQGQICMLTDRLAAYEDTGLEPKQVRKIANVLQEIGQEYNCRFEFVAEVVEKYAKYVEAERNGRLVVLPCKCGECEKYKSVSPKCGNCNRTTVIQHPEDYCNHGKEKSKILRNGENRK